MANIIDNRPKNSQAFWELYKGSFFLYNDDLYEVCDVLDERTGDTYQRAVSVNSGDVIIDFNYDVEVQPVKVTITIEKNL